MSVGLNELIEHPEGTFLRVGDITVAQLRGWQQEKAILDFRLKILQTQFKCVEKQMNLEAARSIGIFIRGVT